MHSRRVAVMMVVALVSLASCTREASITGSYGAGVVSGQVVMAGGGSPAGVEVSVAGTGMSTVVGEDGRFAFAGVPDGAELRFRRGSDVDAGFPLLSASGNIVVEVSANRATPSRRRGASQPGPRLREFEGTIVSVTATQLTIFDSHRDTVTFRLVPETVIREGDATLAPAALQPDFRVHVRASSADEVKTAVLIIVQRDGDGEDDGGSLRVNANGDVIEVGTSRLVVRTVPRGDMRVDVDSSTVFKKHGDRITLAEIKVGDEVNCHGTRVTETVMLAREIEVRGKSGGH